MNMHITQNPYKIQSHSIENYTCAHRFWVKGYNQAILIEVYDTVDNGLS